MRVYGSYNVIERMTLHSNKAAGLELTGTEGFRPSHNRVVNCDSYGNFDPQANGEDADGFGAKFETLGPGNVLRGTRAWSNSDDGYDTWAAGSAVTFDRCWAWDNGFNRREWDRQIDGGWRGDGHGFKLGQRAGPHTLIRVVAWNNKGIGIFENGNCSRKGLTLLHSTTYNNGKNSSLQVRLRDGHPHTIKNSIAIDTENPGRVTEFDAAIIHISNSWNGISVRPADFRSLSPSRATGEREPDGSLPDVDFLRLAPGSDLIDAGIDVGLPYHGKAPDLGAFEACGE